MALHWRIVVVSRYFGFRGTKARIAIILENIFKTFVENNKIDKLLANTMKIKGESTKDKMRNDNGEVTNVTNKKTIEYFQIYANAF